MNKQSERAPEQNEEMIFVSGVNFSSIIFTASGDYIRCIYIVSVQEDAYGYDTCCSAPLKPED